MKKILLGLLVCAGMCACSNEDVVLTDNGVINGEGVDGYISLAINMPTTSSTRAANDVYDDGLAVEYNVNDATLYLLSGENEVEAEVYASYTLAGDWGTESPANDNITTRKQFTQKITSPAAGNLYALVVVNGTAAGVSISNKNSLGTLLNGALQGDVSTLANTSGDGNFCMTNAPLWKGKKGGYTLPTGEVITLAYIDENKIYDTQAEAEANPATEIYVERVVAKVTIDGANAASGLTGISVSVDGFVLDLTNNNYYLVRNALPENTSWWEYASGTLDGTSAGTNQYRFVGDTEVAADLYRTYWAIDFNYDTNTYTSGTSGNRVYPASVSSLAGSAPTGSALTAADGVTGAYCLENTMSVAHMNQDETTRAIVAVTLTVPNADTDGSFYTFEGDKSVLYTEEEILNKVISLFAANGDVQAAEKLWIGADTSDELYSHFTASIDKTQGATDATIDITVSGLQDSYFTGGVIPTVFTSTGLAEVVAQINEDNEFSYYAGGVAYYPVTIKHFGDDLTPWDIAGVEDESYPANNWGKTAEENWLGRYGVLRNNWYDITVTAVNSIGSADVPTAYGEPNDPTESWISVEINILSWAKRTQDVTL